MTLSQVTTASCNWCARRQTVHSTDADDVKGLLTMDGWSFVMLPERFGVGEVHFCSDKCRDNMIETLRMGE